MPATPDTRTPLKLAVVGHTNTGKTSLLRTLTRQPDFGTVADQPGTTRQVEGLRLDMEAAAVAFYDTPGMEDGIGLRDYLERVAPRSARLDGPARIERFLASPEASGSFEQEARVLRAVLQSDAALYVIDARDPVLAKHRDELALLNECGKPILPVLNFTQAPGPRIQAWRTALTRLSLHVQVEFDTVAPALDGEQQLYARLGALLGDQRATLEAIAADLQQQRRDRLQAAWKLIADLLLDIAALRLPASGDDTAIAAAQAQLQEMTREREQACVRTLLQLYRFRPGDYGAQALPITGSRWNMDLFHPQALRDMGLRASRGAAAGAMAGATVDMLSAGLSLGTGALIGAAAGGLWQGFDRLGKRLAGRLRGRLELTVHDDVLRLLAVRMRMLVKLLDRRGHAAQEPVRLEQTDGDGLRRGPLPDVLRAARSQPQWSALNPGFHDERPRQQALAELVRLLAQQRVEANARN